MAETSDPHEPGGISVTIKGDEPGGKFNDPKSPGTWLVFHGSPARIREQLIDVFALDAEACAGRPLYDLVNEATVLFKAAANASKGVTSNGLGGKVLSSSPSSSTGSGDVWDQAAAQQGQSQSAPAAEKEDVDPILSALEACRTVPEVQQVWAENQSAFNSNAEYMAAYKARGKALSQGGSA